MKEEFTALCDDAFSQAEKYFEFYVQPTSYLKKKNHFLFQDNSTHIIRLLSNMLFINTQIRRTAFVKKKSENNKMHRQLLIRNSMSRNN